LAKAETSLPISLVLETFDGLLYIQW